MLHFAVELLAALLAAAILAVFLSGLIRLVRRARSALVRSPTTHSDRLAETIRLAQDDGRWDDPKRRGEAIRSAEKRQRELDIRDRDRKGR